MATVGWILVAIGYLLLGLLVFVVLLLGLVLWSPVAFAGTCSVRADCTDEPQFSGSVAGRIRLLWGVVRIDEGGVSIFGFRVRSRQAQSGLPAESPRTPKAKSRRLRRRSESSDQPPEAERPARRTPAIGIVEVRRLWPDIRSALGRMWAALRLRLWLDVEFGFEDPADTGMAAGLVPAVLESLTWSTNQRQPGSISYISRPVFDAEVLAAAIRLSGRTTVWALAWPWVRLALRRDVRRLWWPVKRRTPGPAVT